MYETWRPYCMLLAEKDFFENKSGTLDHYNTCKAFSIIKELV